MRMSPQYSQASGPSQVPEWMKHTVHDQFEQRPHAPYVCTTCKARKKGCDKRVPTCGYCAQRSLPCEYVAPPSASPTESGLTKRTSTLLSKNGPGDATSPSIVPTSFILNSFQDPSSLDTLVCDQVRDLIQLTDRYTDDVTLEYFQGIHVWYPIICRRRFHNEFLRVSAKLHADFSVLLLAMALVTYKPGQVSRQSPGIERETLYLTTKMLFAHVQAILPSSLRLVQAGMLLTIYEYEKRLPDTAFITLQTCIRMGYAAGLHRHKASTSHLVDEDFQQAEEERSLWWALVIWERTIHCEIQMQEQPLTTPPPQASDPCPSDPSTWNPSPLDRLRIPPPVSAIRLPDVGYYGRQAQQCYLFDQVITTLKISGDENKLKRLMEIDADLRLLMSNLYAQCVNDKAQRIFIGAIAPALRALLLLHTHILTNPNGGYQETERRNSRAAIDTLANMLLEIARTHFEANPTPLDMRPATTPYNFRIALRHMQKNVWDGDGGLARDCDVFIRSLQISDKRWDVRNTPLAKP